MSDQHDSHAFNLQHTLPIETYCMWLISQSTTLAGESCLTISKTDCRTGETIICTSSDLCTCSFNRSSYISSVIDAKLSLSDKQKQVLEVIIQAVHHGNGFQPCRPFALVDKQSIIDSSLRQQLKIPVYDTEYCQCMFLSQIKTRRCSRCDLINTPELMTLCSKCHSTFYCSSDCMVRDSHDHNVDCNKILSFCQLSKDLKNNPFTYSHDTADDSFDDIELTNFLKFHGVYNLGMWIRETPNCLECTALPLYGDLDVSLDPYVLPIEGMLLEDFTIPPPEQPLTDWREYYEWRGFSLDSPVAQLLHYCLTIYHVIQIEALDKPNVSIILAGADKEADLVLTFYELSALMPNLNINLTLVGPMISSTAHGKQCTLNSVCISLYKGLLQDYMNSHPYDVIDLVICMNAGLSAYSTWKDSVLLLHQYKLPCYVTDFCLLSLEYSQKALASLSSEIQSNKLQMSSLQVHEDSSCGNSSSSFNIKLGEIVLNKFRSPLRKHCDSMKLPWFSNSFICKLLYD